APAGDVIFGNLRRPRRDADDGVNREREEHEEIAQDFVWNPDLLEDREQDDKCNEAAGIGAVHPAKLLVKGIRARRRRLSSHDLSPPHSSSATPNSRSILFCCLANTNSMTTNTISEPCAAM